jgi:cyclohexanone monooxygenase
MSTSVFSNCYFSSILQATFFPNFSHLIIEQSGHIAHIISLCGKYNVKALELSQESEDARVREVLEKTPLRRAAVTSCTLGYYYNEGTATTKAAKTSPFGISVKEDMNKIGEWREKDSFDGIRVEYSAWPVSAHW